MTTGYKFYEYRNDGLTPAPVEVFRYPMGDTTVRATADDLSIGHTEVIWVNTPTPDWSVVYSWADLASQYTYRRVLVLPYLPNARGDRDTPNPARMNARLAAGSGITDLITLDPHSKTWLGEFIESSREPTMDRAHPAWDGRYEDTLRSWTIYLPTLVKRATAGVEYASVIAPDKGATDRAGSVALALGVPMFQASKNRDPRTGQLYGYTAPELPSGVGRVLVVDDICDGGGTFKLLADAFSNDITLDLWVSHGGFTKGVETILEDYESVYTTDSLPSAELAVGKSDDHRVRVTELAPYVCEVLETIVKGYGTALWT
jgi:ribose-phosphate pyrophosphokinase